MAFSPIPAYVFGTMFAGIGILSIAAPAADYDVYGLPLEPPTKGSAAGSVSPMIYAKAVRELAFGLTYFALQYHELDRAVTIFSAALCLVALADGVVVWLHGGPALKKKAFSHWGGLVPFAAWVVWRYQHW